MVGRGAELTKPAWMKAQEDAMSKEEANKAAAARAAFAATFNEDEGGPPAPPPDEGSDSDDDDDDEIKNKPIGAVCPAKCTAAGTGVGGGAAGAAASFVVITKDTDGRRIPYGGAQITVKITPGAGDPGPEQYAVVKDHTDGTYTATYSVQRRGDYTVTVECNGISIMGSPFPVFFSGGAVGSTSTAVATTSPSLPNMPIMPGVGSPGMNGMSPFGNAFGNMFGSPLGMMSPGGAAVPPGVSFGEFPFPSGSAGFEAWKSLFCRQLQNV